MSAIFGLFARDKTPINSKLLETMSSAMKHRGPDGHAIWQSEFIGLGHLMFRATPESFSESIPVQSPDGNIVLTASARIDNRDELIPLLGMSKADAAAIPDSQLILRAYQEWGKACVERLLGDFAFALWDSQSQQLICARDHIGVKPLYFFESPAYFAFSTEIRALLGLSFVPQDIDGEIVVNAIVEGNYDKSRTSYRSIERLLPAHLAVISSKGKQISPYWQLNPEYEIRLASDTEYVEQFRSIFVEAVRCRMRSSSAVGAALSGGLDSTSVACVMRNLSDDDIPVFSVIAPDVPRSDDSPYIHEVLETGGFQAHFIRGDQIAPFQHLEQIQWHFEEPMWPATAFINWATLQAVQAEGIKVYLTGHEGDNVVSYGYSLFNELAYQGKWQEYEHQLGMLAERMGRPVENLGKSVYQRYVRHVVPKLVAELRLKATAILIDKMHRYHRISRRHIIQNDILAPFLKLRSPTVKLVNKKFYKSPNFRLDAQTDHRQAHFADLTSGMIPLQLEMLDRLSGAFNVEMRHPYFDKRLIEFCLALPIEQKFRDGWSRYIQRQAMESIVPEKIRGRTTKANFVPLTRYAVLKYEPNWLAPLLNVTQHGKFLNMSSVRDYARTSNQKNEYNSNDLYLLNVIRNVVHLGWH